MKEDEKGDGKAKRRVVRLERHVTVRWLWFNTERLSEEEKGDEKAKEKGPEEGSQDFEQRVTARWLWFNAERSSKEEKEDESKRDQKWGSKILLLL